VLRCDRLYGLGSDLKRNEDSMPLKPLSGQSIFLIRTPVLRNRTPGGRLRCDNVTSEFIVRKDSLPLGCKPQCGDGIGQYRKHRALCFLVRDFGAQEFVLGTRGEMHRTPAA
jgi:hypothetical protein